MYRQGQNPGGRKTRSALSRPGNLPPRRRARPEAGHGGPDAGRTGHQGFSEFQLRLVSSILTDVLVRKKSLDKSYAYFFAKVRIPPVEQGFIIRQVNAMFARLSFFAYAAGLKRPSDFERHTGRLIFVYCAWKGWPLPELRAEDGFERHGVARRLREAAGNPVLSDGCPVWLEELGRSELGEAWDRERAALGLEARRIIRVNTLKCDRDRLAHLLSGERVVTRPVPGCPTALEVTSSSAIFRTEAFKNGLFEQQDTGSQLIGAFAAPQSGERVIDACAGSGGKTLHLAALMGGRGTIIATDTEFWKLQELKRRAARAGAFNIEPRVIDNGKVIKRLYGSADRVLIDAPCSGTGVLRRLPDGKWRDGRARLSELREIQLDLLERYSKMAKVNGIVIYSTCSILPSENQGRIQAFLARSPEFKLLEEKQLLPSGGTDGFYMAKLQRTAAAGPESPVPEAERPEEPPSGSGGLNPQQERDGEED